MYYIYISLWFIYYIIYIITICTLFPSSCATNEGGYWWSTAKKILSVPILFSWLFLIMFLMLRHAQALQYSERVHFFFSVKSPLCLTFNIFLSAGMLEHKNALQTTGQVISPLNALKHQTNFLVLEMWPEENAVTLCTVGKMLLKLLHGQPASAHDVLPPSIPSKHWSLFYPEPTLIPR